MGLPVLIISTHTLTWSVTILMQVYRTARQISTHTLTWSVTEVIMTFFAYEFISTHTLTWSVTSSASIATSGDGNFNSHAHVERDYSVPNASLYR